MGPTLTHLPLLMECTQQDLRPATPTLTLLLQVVFRIVLSLDPHLVKVKTKLQLSVLGLQMDSTPLLQRLMPLQHTYLHLLILLLWVSSHHMIQTSPPQQQVKISGREALTSATA